MAKATSYMRQNFGCNFVVFGEICDDKGYLRCQDCDMIYDEDRLVLKSSPKEW